MELKKQNKLFHPDGISVELSISRWSLKKTQCGFGVLSGVSKN